MLALAALHLVLGLPIHLYWLRGEPPLAQRRRHPAKTADQFHHFPIQGLAAFFVLFSGITTAMGASGVHPARTAVAGGPG